MVGLLGADAGLLWVVAGVWGVRRIWGRPLGLAWGLAIGGAALRWGSLSLADVQAATRLVAPTVLAGPVVVVAGAVAALVAAVLEESQVGGIRSPRLPERATSLMALIVLVPVFLLPGPGPGGVLLGLGSWVLAAAALAGVVIAGQRIASLVPTWVPGVLAAGGVVAMGIAS